jgi:hypothetical protein
LVPRRPNGAQIKATGVASRRMLFKVQVAVA